MNWSLLFNAALPIAPHALVALAILVLGGVQLALPKGTYLHKRLGWVWVIGMGFVAASGLFIWDIRLWGPFSPIHILSIVTLVNLTYAVRAARRGNITGHKAAMISLVTLALIIPGLFTLMPGRVMHAVMFGS